MELGLIVLDNKVVVGSRRVARNYAKEHRDVLRAIRAIVEQVPDTERNFALSEYTDPTGRKLPEYIMDRQGFSILVMGFTGTKAREFTYKYTKAFEEMAARVSTPKTQLEVLQHTVTHLVQQEQRLAIVEAEQKHIKDTIINRPDQWRQEINRMFNRVVEAVGQGKFAQLRRETYALLEKRAHVDLNRRLANMRARMVIEGATKTAITKANRLDVIEADPKLQEIYTAIMKEYVIRYTQGVA